MHYSSIDIFCTVIDNFGDIGVAYRFARELKRSLPTCRIRMFVDDLHTLSAIEPAIQPAQPFQSHNTISIIDTTRLTPGFLSTLNPADVLVEAFACHIPESIMAIAVLRPCLIINLDHLSAEPWVAGYHLKESMLPIANIKKYFFMPGFTENTGGVIIDHRLQRIKPWLKRHRKWCLEKIMTVAGHHISDPEKSQIGSVFTYTRGFDNLLNDLESGSKPTILLVFGRKSHVGMIHTIERLPHHRVTDSVFKTGRTTILLMPFVPQRVYDVLLCLCDFNIVRGEDSLVRAIMAGRPFIWNAYLQEKQYQLVKVRAFADLFETYCTNPAVFANYHRLLLEFNSATDESSAQVTPEHYHAFFDNSVEIEHATGEMCYFLARRGDLVKQFIDFLATL